MFEDDHIEGFGPITRLRHVSLLRWGTKSILDALTERIPDAKDVSIWGRPELAGVSKEATQSKYNDRVYGPAFFVNARVRPTQGLVSPASWSQPFVTISDGQLVAARLESSRFKPGVISKSSVASISKGIKKVSPPPDPLFSGYWDLVESNGLAIAEQARRFEEPIPLPMEVEVRGPATNVMMGEGAEIEGNVTLDARRGPIILDRGASVESFSRIMGPCYIGRKAKIYSALIGGGTSIFDSCKVGGQVENSIILPFSNKAHYGYMGDSYVGSWVNIGAGCTVSNLKNTYGNVRLQVGEKKVDSGMVKLGPVIGDMTKLSIGALVYAGKSIGTGAQVSGLASSDVPSFTYYDGGSGKRVELLLDSILETQRRMMERRGLSLSRTDDSLIRKAFASTSLERKKAGVKKGPIA